MQHAQERRKEWMLWLMKRAGTVKSQADACARIEAYRVIKYQDKQYSIIKYLENNFFKFYKWDKEFDRGFDTYSKFF